MSLDWNVTQIEDHENVCFEVAEEDIPHRGVKKGKRYLKDRTDGLIWLSWFCYIGPVTEENVEEFVHRVAFYEKLNGAYFRKRTDEDTWVDDPYDPDLIRAHVGLITNVCMEERGEWLHRTFEMACPGAVEMSERSKERSW